MCVTADSDCVSLIDSRVYGVTTVICVRLCVCECVYVSRESETGDHTEVGSGGLEKTQHEYKDKQAS